MSGDDWKTVREVAFYASAKRREAILATLDRIEAEAARRCCHCGEGSREYCTLCFDAAADEKEAAADDRTKRAEASAAAMRDVLEKLREGFGQMVKTGAWHPDAEVGPVRAIDAALATDAGRAKLDELENAHASCRIERARAEKAEAHVERLKQSHALVVGEADFAQKRAEKAEAEVEATRAELQTECNHKTDVIQQLHAEVERLNTSAREGAPWPEEVQQATAKAVAQARREERERCARRVDEMHDSLAQPGEGEAMNRMAGYAAKAIRALGDE